MESIERQRYCVEVWGDVFDGYTTELFYTRKEAEAYFKRIRRSLNSERFIKRKDEIIDTLDKENYVKITDFENFF